MAAAFSFQRHSEQLHDQLAESRQTSVRLTKQLQEWHKKYFDVRHDMSQLVHEHDSAMQSARLRDMELQQIITHLELQNTQLEYDKRVVSASLHDLEAKYNRLLEEKALWQHDNEIRWQLEEHNQRLKDEVSEANVEIYALRSKMIKMELRLKEVESIHLRTELTGAQRDFETRSHRLKTLQATLNPPQPQQQQPPSLPQQTLQSQSQALQSANHESLQTTTAVTASTFSATDAAAGAAAGGGETAAASMPRPPPASSATSNVAGGNAIGSDAPRRPTSNDHRALETDGLGISSASHEQGVTMAESFSHTHHQHVEHHQPRQSQQSVYQSEQQQQHRQQHLQHSVRIQTSASHSSMRQTRSQTQNASDAAESTSAARPRSASPSRTAASHTQQRNASMTSVVKPTTAVSPVVLTRSASPEHRRMSAQSTAAQPTSSMQSVARIRAASASSPTITQPPFRTKKTAGSPQAASLFLSSTSATTTHETSRRRTSSSTIKSSAVSAAPAPKPASTTSVFHAPAGTQRSASPTHQPPQQAAAQPAWVEPSPQRAKPPSMTPYQQQQHQHQMQQQQLQQRRSLSQSPTRSAHQHQHQHQQASAAPPSTAATNRYARLPPPPPPPSTHGPANPVLSRPTRPPPPPPVQSSSHHVYSHSQKTSSSAYRQTSWSASLSDSSMDDSDPAFDSAAMQQTAYSNRSSNSTRPSTASMHRAPEPYPDQVPAPAPAPVRSSDAGRPRYLGGATHFTTDNSKDASISLDDIPASVASQAVRLVHDESQLSLLSVSEYDPGRPVATGRSSPAPQMAMGKSTDTIVRSHAELPPLPVKADAVAGADKTGGSGFVGEKDGGSAVGHTQDRFASISQSAVDVRNRVIEMESKSVQQTVQQQQQQKRSNTSLMDTTTDTVTSASQSQHSIRGSEAVSPQNAPFAGAWGPPAKPRQPSVQLSRPFFAGAVVGAQAHSQQQHSTRHDSFDHSSSTPLSSRSFSPLPSALPSQQSLGHQPSQPVQPVQPAQPVQPHASLTGAIVAAASPSVGMSGDGVRTSAITDAKGYASPAIQALSALVRKRLLAERVYPSFLPLPVHNTAALLADVEMTIYRAELFLDRLDAFVLGIPFDEAEPSEEQQQQLRRALSRITESPAASRASQRASVSHSRASSARSVSDDSQASRSSVWSHSARGHSRRSADSRSRSRSSSISENAELDRKPYSQHPSTYGNMSGHESNGAGDLARDSSAEPESIPHGYAGSGSSTDAMAKGGYNMASQSLGSLSVTASHARLHPSTTVSTRHASSSHMSVQPSGPTSAPTTHTNSHAFMADTSADTRQHERSRTQPPEQRGSVSQERRGSLSPERGRFRTGSSQALYVTTRTASRRSSVSPARPMNTDTLSRSTPSPTRARPFSFQSQQSPSRPSTPGVTQDTESFRGRRLSRSRVGLAHEQTDTMQGRSEYEASYCDKSPTRARMASLGQVSPVRDLSDMQRVSWYPRTAGGEVMVPSDPNGRNPLNLGSPMPHSGHAQGPSGSRGRRASDAPVSSRKAWQDAEDLQAESHKQTRYDQKQQEQQQQQQLQERQHRAAVLDRNVDHVQEAFNAGYVPADHEPRASQLQVAHDAAAQDARRPDVPQRSFAAWEATPVGGANRRLQQAGASTALGASFPSPLPWWDRPQPSQQTYRRGARRGPQQYGDSDDSAAVQDAICATEMSQSNVVIRSATSGAGDGSFVRSSVHVAAAQGGDVVGGAMATATAATKSGLYTVTASVATTADGGVTGTTAVVGDSLMASTSTSGGAGGAGGAMARQAGGRRAAGHSSGVRFSVNPITWDEQDAGGGARGGGSGGAYAATASATTAARAQPRNVAMAAFELRGDQGGRGQRRGGQRGPDVEVDPITWQPTGRSRTPSPARFRS